MTDHTEHPWRLPGSVAGQDVKLHTGAHHDLSLSTKARLYRILRKVPEVMVKVIGRSRGGAGHLKGHLDYITRNVHIHA